MILVLFNQLIKWSNSTTFAHTDGYGALDSVFPKAPAKEHL